jgi:hypothetical protein
MQISACGLSSLNANYISFIGAEDDVCALAKKFLCHVFYTENRKMAKQVTISSTFYVRIFHTNIASAAFSNYILA